MVWWKRKTDNGENWWFYLKNHIRKVCYRMIIIVGHVCTTDN